MSAMKIYSDKITYEKFKRVFNNSNGGEFELNFNATKDQYMIQMYEDSVSFCKEGGENSKEILFPDIDTLYENAEVGNSKLKDVWDDILEIVVNGTYSFDEYCEEYHLGDENQ